MQNELRLIPNGTPAPDFDLPDAPEQHISLTDFRGQPVVLLFYAADFSHLSSDETALYNEVLPEFQRHEAQVLGISTDNVWSHLAFAKEQHLHFPLLSDFHPKGAVARSYGVYDEDLGCATRAVYVIDSAGIVAWGYLATAGVNPAADGTLAAVELLDRNATLALG